MKNLVFTAFILLSTSSAFAENYSLNCRDAYGTTVIETKKGDKTETTVKWNGGKASFREWGTQKWFTNNSTGVVPNEKYYFTTAGIQYTSDGGSVPNYNVHLVCAKITN